MSKQAMRKGLMGIPPKGGIYPKLSLLHLGYNGETTEKPF